MHDQSYSASQPGLVPLLRCADTGNDGEWIALHFRLNQGAHPMPEGCDVTHNNNLRWRERCRYHMHAATKRGTHSIDGLSPRSIAGVG